MLWAPFSCSCQCPARAGCGSKRPQANVSPQTTPLTLSIKTFPFFTLHILIILYFYSWRSSANRTGMTAACGHWPCRPLAEQMSELALRWLQPEFPRGKKKRKVKFTIMIYSDTVHFCDGLSPSTPVIKIHLKTCWQCKDKREDDNGWDLSADLWKRYITTSLLFTTRI